MTDRFSTIPDATPLTFLADGGEMGERIRAFDWSRTPVGPVSEWPQSLKTSIRIMLDARYPMFVWWGPSLTNFYNDPYIDVLGKRHPTALGQPAARIWSDIWHVVGPQAQAALEGRATWTQEQLLVMERNGFKEETYFTYSYSPLHDDDGSIRGVFCACTEDTNRVLGQRRLRTLRALAEQTSQTKSVEGACEAASHTLAENQNDLPFTLLYLLDEAGVQANLAGQTGFESPTTANPVLVNLDDETAPWPFRQVVKTGKDVEVAELPEKFGQLPGGDGQQPQRAVIVPMARPGFAQPAGFVVAGVSPRLVFNEDYKGFLGLLAGQVATAVANARAYEDEKRRAEALAELDRAKTIFFSNVSHEFRTPLTLILGPLDDAIADTHESWQRDRLLTLQRNALRLQKLVNTLLDFSRIEAGRVQANYRPTDLATFTQELVSNFRSACEKAGLDLRVDCPPLPEAVHVDGEMWEKIVLNLLSNAFKFTQRGHIDVSLHPAGEFIELTVKDTGVGIPADQLPRLFERFHRIEGVSGRSQEGSGIGLALVRELVRLHGGDIRAESVLGKGTTFTVTLPVGTAHLPTASVLAASPSHATALRATHYVEEALRWLPDAAQPECDLADGSLVENGHSSARAERPRVLVADDNADMRQYVTRLLSPSFEVRAVPDGAVALEVADAWKPNLVLTDIMMPRLDGFTLLKELRANLRTADIPLIVLSARAGEESRIESVEAGADDYLVKPFSARELLARVTAHLHIARIRKEANEAVRAREMELREAQRVAHVGSWRWDAKSDATTGSEELFLIYGLDPAPQKFPDFKDQDGTLYPHDSWQRIYDAARQTMRTGVGYELDVQAFRNGKPIWITARSEVVKNAFGEVVGLRGTVQDITERKRVDEALRLSEERLRLITDAVPTLISYVDSEGIYRLNNRAYEEWFRHTRNEVTGRHMRDVLGEAAWTVVGPRVQAAFAGQTVNYEAEVEYKDAGKRWIDANYVPHLDNGRVVGLFVLVNDITTRKLAEQAVRQSEALFRNMADNAPAMLWVTDPTGYCTYLSALWYQFTGRTPGKDVGYIWLEAIHPDDLAETKRIFSKANESHVPFSIDYRLRRHDGEYRWAVDAALPRFDGDKFQGFVGCVFDVHERKTAEDANSRLVENLQHADQRKDEFLATLAHELRNPLAPIRNGLQIMRLANGAPEATEQARTMMERQLGQMVHLVDDLLDLSRISRGKIELRKERVELAKVVQHAIETSRPLIEEAGHELKITVPLGPIYVDADVTRLTQVFSNLLNNAAKYTEPGGRLQLTVQQRPGEAVVSVKDNGVGIPPHMLHKVFEMFTQVDRHLERSKGGLGIGLSIVKRLVEMHGGSAEVESAGPGTGSEFIIRLPVVLPVAQTNGGDEETVPPSGPRRIMVVDDNKDAAMSLAMMLQLMGHEAKTAHDGMEALEVAEVFHPDLILLDIGMPRLNGHETATRIREQPWGKNVVLVALTGWGQDEDRRKSDEAGFDSHMVKPIEPSALERLLARLQSNSA